MHVFLLGPYPPPHGGIQTHVVALRDFLRGRGVSCSVINVTHTRRPDRDGVYYPSSALAVARLLLRVHADVVHFHFGGHFSGRLLGLATLITSLPRRKTVLTCHSGGLPRSRVGRSASRRSLRGLALRRFDRVIGVNDEIVDMLGRFGVSASRLRLIAPYVLPASPSVGPLTPELQRFFEGHRPVLLTVGLLESEYDLPTQVQALELLRRRFPRAGLAIIGSGSLDGELRSQVAMGPCAGNVLVCGDVPHPVTIRAIAQADIFLRTSLYDGDSLAVREAIHLGTPVVATDAAERPAGVTLVPTGDANALATAIHTVAARAPHRGASTGGVGSPLEGVLSIYGELCCV